MVNEMVSEPEQKGCCTPSRATASGSRPTQTDVPLTPSPKIDAVHVPCGMTCAGTNAPLFPDDGEGPLRRRKIKLFQISASTVTNRQFAEFVTAAKRVPEAERFGRSFVFWKNLPKNLRETRSVEGVE